ncbi:MAG TPA: M28 family metallopeptidase [Thermoanaerobaculia bacterium]|nr:M28 family metallopeptidase [Thermoanaerobaculia bacterium]
MAIRFVVAATLTLALSAHAYDFRSEPIRAHMKFLASDLLEGRGAGTRGYDIAANYVAAQFEAAGVAPGAGGSYFQIIPFRKTIPDDRSTVTITPDGGPSMLLRYGDGFVTSGDPLHPDRTVEGRVTVVGYGVTAPELKHDDYAGIDVRGRIVVVFSGAPARFDGPVRAHYSSSLGKIENAVAHGAAGVMMLRTLEEAERSPWERTARQSRLGAMHWLRADGTPQSVSPEISSPVTLNPDVADTILGRSGQNLKAIGAALKDGSFRAFELPMKASIRTISSHQRAESANVVGVVRGSDPKLRDEYLVYSSHLDHVGITEPVNGDAINNGAFDNASGIAALIEIAKAMADQKPAPRRSILFLATTAEEKGLRGADYFAINPTVPRTQLVGNINIDQVMMIDAVSDVIVHGIDASTLGDVARRVAAKHSIGISDDPFPEEVVFVRSDQYPFVKQGIPALYIDPGYKAVAPGVDAKQNQMAWIKSRYHTPSDDLDQKMDFSVPAALARFDFLIGLEVANADARPAWKPGNFFGETFGRR